MHKQMCHHLMRFKENGVHIMQRKEIHHIKRLTMLKNRLRKKDQRIYYDKIFYNRWDRLKTTHPDV